MSGVIRRHVDPYEGLTASEVTSRTVDLRVAVDWTLSWYTTAGTTSAHTLQLSNWSGRWEPSVATGWVNYTAFGTGTPSIMDPPNARYARVLRTASGASVVVDVHALDG